MGPISFDQEFSKGVSPNKDLLSGFSKNSEKRMVIQSEMSVKEISEVVSEKLMAIIREQFNATEEKFLAEKK